MAEESDSKLTQPNPDEEASEAKSPGNDPLDLKKNAIGIGGLLCVCLILGLVAKYLPLAVDPITNTVQEIVGIEVDKKEEDLSGDDKGSQPEKESTKSIETKGAPEPNPTPKNPTQADPKVVVTNPKNAHARKQLVEQLGGAEKVTIRHIAYSTDESRMMASIRFHEENQVKNITFQLNEFNQYVPEDDSIISQDIQIWPQE